MTAQPVPIPQMLADRFVAAFKAFVDEVAAAVADAAARPELASAPAFRVWHNKVLPLLQQQEQATQAAAAQFRQGDAGPLLAIAADKRSLAKDLDGFPLDFAGSDHAAALDRLETSVVTTAFQLCAAAKIP
ncbi:MAG: hypothetical protein WA294_09735 [Acidobacteriaceae bacterium]